LELSTTQQLKEIKMRIMNPLTKEKKNELAKLDRKVKSDKATRREILRAIRLVSRRNEYSAQAVWH
jgi:hypothetical protein